MRYYGKIHSKLPIFRVKSAKIYTGQKKFTGAPPVAPVTNMRYGIESFSFTLLYFFARSLCSGPSFAMAGKLVKTLIALTRASILVQILFSEKTLDQKFIEMQLDFQYWTSLKALVQSVLRHYRFLFQRWLWFNELFKTIFGRITIIYIYLQGVPKKCTNREKS